MIRQHVHTRVRERAVHVSSYQSLPATDAVAEHQSGMARSLGREQKAGSYSLSLASPVSGLPRLAGLQSREIFSFFLE